MSLHSRIHHVPADRVAVVDGRSTRFGQLLRGVNGRASLFDGRRVMVRVSSVSSIVRSLLHLDGVAAAIFPVSQSMSLEAALSLADGAGCDVFLCDERPDSARFQSRNWQFVDLMELDSGSVSAYEPRNCSTEWLLCTSGTTGTPKLVSHSLESLTRTTKGNTVRGAVLRWGLLYDYPRFAGLQVILQAVLSGSVLIAPDLNWSLERQTAFLADHECTHLSATPTLWRRLMMTTSVDRLPLRQVTLGGEIADQRILNTLRNKYPDARITHIYASTEAGVGFSVNDGREGFPGSFLTESPLSTQLRVEHDRLYVRNSHVRPDYIGGPAFADASGFVDTGDVVERRGDRFVFMGRAQGVINVGGNKVHPEVVERILLEHPNVLQARVSARMSSITGQLVQAEVVGSSGLESPTELGRLLLQYCQTKLAPFQVPATIRVVPELSLTPAGKLVRDAG